MMKGIENFQQKNFICFGLLRIKPHVKYHKFDRKKPYNCLILQDKSECYDYVLDFSGYKAKYLSPILTLLKNRIK